MRADVEMVMKENIELQTALEKEREERKKVDEQVKTLDSRMDAFRELKMKLDSDLNEGKRKNEKLQTELDKARLTLTQRSDAELNHENVRLTKEADRPSSCHQRMRRRIDILTSRVSQL
ncbi:hypothetical protein Dimus_001099 [Dionaea muscipula]